MASSTSSRSSHSLKGITSTNDDPNACAFCSGPFWWAAVDVEGTGCQAYGTVVLCCGKRICKDCVDSRRTLVGAGRRLRCSFCNAPSHSSSKDEIGALKKHAKKGAAWAQSVLGSCYDTGESVSQPDPHQARRWCEKAAKQGHPEAVYRLAYFFLNGIGGCSADFSKARELAEKARSLDTNLTDASIDLLLGIADRIDDSDEAKSILMPLAEEGRAEAQCDLGAVLCFENDILNAKFWFETAALQGHKLSVHNTLVTCKELMNIPEAQFWFNVISKPEVMPDERERKENVKSTGVVLRKVRDICGGCCTGLDGDRRQYCKQCKTYCYCSRECQKLHWNRIGEGGHRSECMGVKCLKERMKVN